MALGKVSFKDYDGVVHALIRNGCSVEEAVLRADEAFDVEDTHF